jgi:hypothetical protein
MLEYRCAVLGIVASRDRDDPVPPDDCPECGGQISTWTADGDGLSVEAVRASSSSSRLT